MTDNTTMSDLDVQNIEYVTNRLEEALKKQRNTTGEHSVTPLVGYCFDCDEITVDSVCPDECVDHTFVSSDGHEHGGIQTAISVLNHFAN